MKHTAFAVRLEFDTPVILGRRANLDGLLANLLVDENLANGMDELAAIAHAHANIPLAMWHNVHAGSTALIADDAAGYKPSPLSFISSMDRHLHVMASPETMLRPRDKARKGASPFDGVPGNLMSRCTAVDGIMIAFIGNGDVQRVAELLRTVTNIGKKRNVGYGRLKRPPQISEIGDHDGCGVMSRDGTMLRPVPKDFIDGLPTWFDLAYETYRPPYWKGERVLCYVPPHRTWSSDAINDFVS